MSFLQNTSPIPDEMLAHRLGMVPLVSKLVGKGLRYTRVSMSNNTHLAGHTTLLLASQLSWSFLKLTLPGLRL